MLKYHDHTTHGTIDKVITATKLQAVMLGILILSLFLQDYDFSSLLLRLGFWTGFYVLFVRSLKRLLYSFWTFIGIITLYSFSFFIDPGLGDLNFSEILVVFVLIALSAWMVKSLMGPIYYSKLNWWEYDFRYRHDIKAEIKTDGEPIPIRLNDVRQNEISIVCFQDLDPEKQVTVQNIAGLSDVVIKGQIATIRNNIVGRPDIIGLRLLDDEENKKTFKKVKSHIDNLKLSKKKVVRYE